MNKYDLSKDTASTIGAIVGTAAGAIATKLVIDWLSEDEDNSYTHRRHKRHR